MRYTRMQEWFGYNKDHKCGECAHCIRVDVGQRTVYKCKLWLEFLRCGSSSATDIRLKHIACNKFKEAKMDEAEKT